MSDIVLHVDYAFIKNYAVVYFYNYHTCNTYTVFSFKNVKILCNMESFNAIYNFGKRTCNVECLKANMLTYQGSQ